MAIAPCIKGKEGIWLELRMFSLGPMVQWEDGLTDNVIDWLKINT